MELLEIIDKGINQKALRIKIDSESFDKMVEETAKKILPNLEIKGFRKGHATRKQVEAFYGAGYFYKDTFNTCLPQAYFEALKESDLDVVSYPEYAIEVAHPTQGCIFTATVYTKPIAEISDYKGLEARVESREATETQINAKLEQIRKEQAREITIEDNSPAIKDDIVNINFSGSVDGVKFKGGTAENYNLTLGSGAFIPGFEDQIIGHKIGDEFDVNVIFPENYQAEDLKGKAAVFACKINSIRRNELPDLDDEFAKDVSEFDTLDEYKKDIKRQLEEEISKLEEEDIRRYLMEQLAEKVTVEVPQIMYDTELENMINYMTSNLKRQGLTFEQYLKFTNQTMDTFKAKEKVEAEKHVKIRLALAAITKAENIAVTDEEIEKRYQELADENKITLEQTKEYFTRKDILEGIANQKALDLVYENATVIHEIPPKEPKEEKKKRKKAKEEKKEETVDAKEE